MAVNFHLEPHDVMALPGHGLKVKGLRVAEEPPSTCVGGDLDGLEVAFPDYSAMVRQPHCCDILAMLEVEALVTALFASKLLVCAPAPTGGGSMWEKDAKLLRQAGIRLSYSQSHTKRFPRRAFGRRQP